MEKLSNQNKKELFMSMVEKAKNGTLDMMRMTESRNMMKSIVNSEITMDLLD